MKQFSSSRITYQVSQPFPWPLVLGPLTLFLYSCASPIPNVTPTPNPTDLLVTRVVEVLTANAATQTAAPTVTPTFTPLPTETPMSTATPTMTPTLEATPTPEVTPYPTVGLGNFPEPPPAFGGDAHFY